MITTEVLSRLHEPPAQSFAEPTFLARVRLRAQRRVLWQRYWWANSNTGAGQELAITAEEVDRILTAPETQAQAEEAFYATDSEAAALNCQIAIADRQMAADE